MSVIFGSARNGENGATGNAAGDQSGSEVSTQTFYVHSKGWYGFAPKSADVGAKLAEAMQQACDNNNIGYDQNDRDSLLTQYKKYGSIKAIATKCECDCSSLVRVCIYQATGTLLSDFTTASEPDVLASSGLFESKKTVSSASDCTLGMILVTKTKGHTGIIVSGAANVGSSGTGTTSSGGTTSTYTGTTSRDDSLTGKYTVTASSLNIRSGPGTSYNVLTTAPRGATVQNYGYYATVDGVKWLYVQVSNVTGFASSEWLTKAAGDTTATSSTNKLSVDGQIGAKTVKKLQQVLGTTADGFIDGQPSNGRQYWLSIISEACKWTGGKSACVTAWQQYLKDAGYSPSGVDGKLGKNTAKAAQKYLIAKGFSCGSAGADGKFGTASAKGLQQWLNTK